jgi:hypothetical protein
MKLSSLTIPSILVTSLVGCAATGGDGPDDELAQASWRDTISTMPTADGCFQASYPNMAWEPVECTAAPNRAIGSPRAKLSAHVVDALDKPFTVGDGADYALHVPGLILSSTGSFPQVTGVTTETDGGVRNGYSIQLNSNFMTGTAACNRVSGCLSWAQFVYSSEERSAFIQNWLIGIGRCPDSSWINAGGGDCFKNSAAVSVSTIAITSLASLKMTGTAASGGNDGLTFANGSSAFKTSERDTVTGLAGAWDESEFNIIGDGGGSEAVFNKGSSVTVEITASSGSTAAPTCISNDGTTGETNNLTLGACRGTGGTTPNIQFTESN